MSKAPATVGRQLPSDGARIWRYMDVTKFVALVFSKKMWFPKLQELWINDPWEGFGAARGLRRPSRSRAPKVWPASEASTLFYAEFSGRAAETIRNAPKHVYANSWCLGVESLGMWERYGSGARGVAIESTVGQFKLAMNRELRDEQYAFDDVKYHDDLRKATGSRHDFTKGNVPASGKLWQLALKVAFNKRTCFRDESEWRAAIFQEPLRPKVLGLTIPVDLEVLISSVRVGPRTDKLTMDAVGQVMKAAGLSKPMEESGILKSPRRRQSKS